MWLERLITHLPIWRCNLGTFLSVGKAAHYQKLRFSTTLDSCPSLRKYEKRMNKLDVILVYLYDLYMYIYIL